MSKGSDSSMPQNTANMRVVEGSYAVAHAVMCCRPDVISAYPITPQTHIVENLSQLVADGELDSAFLTVDSEFSALSVLVGSTACAAEATPRPPARD